MGKIALFLVFVLVVSQPLNALVQAPLVDFWKTREECLAAEGAPFYYPVKPKACKLETKEKIVGNPEDACFLMEIPDRSIEGGKGFVRIEKGRRIVARGTEIVRLEECCNQFFETATPIPAKPGPLGPIGPAGPSGPQGPPGESGKTEKIQIPQYTPTPPNPITNTNTVNVPKGGGCGKGCAFGILAGIGGAIVAGWLAGRNKGGGGTSVTVINSGTGSGFQPIPAVPTPAPTPPAPGPVGVPLPPLPTGSGSTGGTSGGASPLPSCSSPPCTR